MRLIAEFQTEKQAFGFQTYLQNHGVNSLYDTAQSMYRVWIVEEDDFDKAITYYQEWQHNPQEAPPPPLSKAPEHAQWRVRIDTPQLRSPFSMNNFIIILCGFIYLWMGFQVNRFISERGEYELQYVTFPLMQELLFDTPPHLTAYEKFFDEYPVKTEADMKQLPADAQDCFKKIEATPTWAGIAGMLESHDWSLLQELPKGTLFEKIREGQVWRLFTPVLLHGSFLHILFNMLWLFILGRQIEERIGITRYLLLSLLLGVMGNVTQYLVSGPVFLGYSGIITGMVGFIWMRQKIAPWEGYPLQKPVIVFITVFVLAMLVLGLIFMIAKFFNFGAGYDVIANTAHVMGGIFGVLLGRLSIFARSTP
jgi:GlpG protein